MLGRISSGKNLSLVGGQKCVFFDVTEFLRVVISDSKILIF